MISTLVTEWNKTIEPAALVYLFKSMNGNLFAGLFFQDSIYVLGHEFGKLQTSLMQFTRNDKLSILLLKFY